MTTTYTVGAEFKINGVQALDTLKLLGEGFAKVESYTKNLLSQFDTIGKFKFGTLEGALGGLGIKFDDVSRQIGGAQLKLQEIADTRFSGLNRGLTNVASRLDRIENRAKAAASALSAMPALPAAGGGGGGNRLPGTRGSGSSAEGSARLKDHAHGRHGAGADLGMFGFIGGEATGEAFADILKHGMELQHVQEQMLMGGMKSKEIAEATAAAWGEASKYGLSVTKVMDDIKELRFPFGSTEHAINFIDPLEKMRVVLNSVHEGSGTESANSVYELARAGELKGLQTPEEFLKYFDDMTKVISATGGKVTPNDFMQAMKYGRVASLGWNEEFTTKYLPTLMQSLGPSGAGTASMSLFGTLAQGKVGKRALEQMQDIGLIGDPSKIIYDKVGPVGFNPGAIKGTDEFVQNPALWAQHVLLPLLTTKFGDLGNDTNRLHAAEGLGGLFGNRMSAQAIAEFILRMQSINKDVNLLGQAHGIGGVDELLAHDPTAAMNNFKASWSNLLTSLGSSSVEPAILAMNGIAFGLNAMSKFGEEHPDGMKLIVGALGGLTAGLGALALVGLAAFLPGGLVTAAVTTLTTTLGGMALINWDKIADYLMMFGSFVKNTVGAIEDFFTRITKAFTAGLAGLWAGIVGKLRSIPGMSAILGDDVSGIMGHPAHPSSTKPATPHWYDGMGAFGGGFVPMAYETMDGNNGSLTDAVADGFLKAFQRLGAGGGSVSGGGFANASFETFDTGPSGGGSLPSIRRGRPHSYGPGPSTAGAGRGGDDPALTARARESWDFWKSKGLDDGAVAGLLGMEHGENNFYANGGMFGGWGDQGAAYGSFMWHKDRRARIFAGTGINVIGASHQKQLEAAYWEMTHGEAGAHFLDHLNGLGPAAAAALGVNGFERPLDRRGASRLRGAYAEQWYRRFHGVGRPPVARTKPSSGDIVADARQPDVIIHLDGKKIAHVVGRQMASAQTYPRSVGGMDTHGTWASPSASLVDAG